MFGDPFRIPEEWIGFVDLVNSAYHEADMDRNMLERSLELSSQELLQANSEMRAIFEVVPDIFFRVDADGNILDCKAGNTSGLVASRRSLIGKKIDDIPLAPIAEKFRKALEVVRDTHAGTSFEYSLFLDGVENFYEARWIPLLDGQAVVIVRNITDRKDAEKALKNSEAFFRAVTQNSSDIIIIVDPTAKIIYVNSSIERFLGYRPDEFIGKSAFDFIVPSDLPRALQDFGKALLTRDATIPNSFGVRHKDGATHILEGLGANLFDHPAVNGFVMNVRDITDRRRVEKELETYRENLEDIVAKRTHEISQINAQLLRELFERKEMEKALKDSEKKYRDFLENAPIGVGIVDLSGKIQYINNRIEEITGWTREELIDRNGFGLDAFDESTRENLLERFMARIEGDGAQQLEIPVRKKDNTLLWVQVIANILRKDGDPIGMQLVFVNITEKKKAQEALQKSEDRFRTLISRSSDVMSILDQEGRFIYNSLPAEKIFGYRLEDLVGKSAIDFIHPDDREIARKEFAGLVNRSKSAKVVEFRALRGNGKWGYYEARGNNLLDDPDINGIVLNIRDIQDRKQAEEERNALLERLYRAEKMESLGTMAGGVAHDLNNVLGVVVGYAELIHSDMDDNDPNKKNVGRIIKSGQKASAIIQDLLTLARRNVHVSEVVDMNAVIAEFFLTPEFERMASYHPDILFRKEMAPDLLNIKVSPVHLEKTVMNLMSNAVEAINDAGEVTITTKNRYLRQPVRGYSEVREGDYVVLSVQDTGQGISPSDIGRIFEPFYTKKVMGRSGTGLGLAVVWGTVKDHQGYIEVQSEIGKGATFTLYFPATREVSTKSPKPVSMDSYMGAGESVLIVDDLPEQREVAASLIERLGYQAHAVASGEEAVAYLKTHKADVLLLDMLMDPGIDGLETYKRVLDIHPGQKAVIVSGYSETERVRQAMELGVSAYIRKPYLLDKIGIALREALYR